MAGINPLMGNEEWSNSTSHTQVYLATHDGADNRLPLKNRSFISFTYGGKNIEDFSFISVTSGDMMTRRAYADFADNTSSSDVLNGQYYWGTHFTTNKLTLRLATDEITEKELLEFKKYFCPGPPKELILAENPNRAIMARIATVPEYNVLPFEKKIQKTILDITKTISTTVYRGDINLEFVMDDPFWYSIKNVLPSSTRDVNGEWVSTLENPDLLKVILEDDVPMAGMFEDNSTITGTESAASTIRYAVAPLSNADISAGKVVAIAGGVGNNGTHIDGAKLYRASVVIDGTSDEPSAYLYYAGTAPAPTKLTFKIVPQLKENDYYIQYPLNSILNNLSNSSQNDYNSLTVGTQQFKFSTPSLLTGYNQALSIVSSEAIDGFSTLDLRLLLHDGVKEYYSRAWALAVLNYLEKLGTSGGVDSSTNSINDVNTFLTNFSINMKNFLLVDNEISSVLFEFDSKIGTAKGTFTINKCTNVSSQGMTYSAITVTENVGDMVYDKYLYLNDRNYINERGKIALADCTPIATDYPTELQDFEINYKYMYL